MIRYVAFGELAKFEGRSCIDLPIAAHIFDDSLMVAAAVVALDKFKLQERSGRRSNSSAAAASRI